VFVFVKCVSVVGVLFTKLFAFTLLSSVKQARSMLHQQRAARGTLPAVVSSANEQQPPATVGQSDFTQLLSQYRETELQVHSVHTGCWRKKWNMNMCFTFFCATTYITK